MWAALARAARVEELPYRDVKRRALTIGVQLALAERARRQYHRFRKGWLLGNDGRMLALTPKELPVGYWERHAEWDPSYPVFRHYMDWLAVEAINAAEAGLLDRPYPGTGDNDPLNTAVEIPSDADPASPDEPLEALLAEENAREAGRELARILEELATPRQRELVRHLWRQVDQGGEPNPAAAAAALRMKTSTARVQLHLLRRKAAGS